jgi:uncharacterized membrane protein (Fun14 family)
LVGRCLVVVVVAVVVLVVVVLQVSEVMAVPPNSLFGLFENAAVMGHHPSRILIELDKRLHSSSTTCRYR